MNKFSLFVLIVYILHSENALAQFCGPCAVDYAYTVSGVHPDTLPPATAGSYYEFDLTFVLLADTTVDILGSATTLDFLNYHLMEPVGMPYGLHATSGLGDFPVDYNPADGLYGCAKICGTPLVAGFYEVTVPIIATLESPGGDNPAEYNLYIEVLPAIPDEGGIEETATFGCSPQVITFETGHPGDGDPGYSYFWDFGNGYTSTDENPSPQIYSAAGPGPSTYIVTHIVTIDTIGYLLDYVTVLTTGCDDCTIFGCTGVIEGEKPDLYVKIDPLGVNTFPGVLNTFPPITFPLNIPVDPGTNYTLQVKDDDDGGFGADDGCGFTDFMGDYTGVHTLDIGSSTIELSISHPEITYTYYDTITIYPYPETPVVAVSGETVFCEGDSVILLASGDTSYLYQWYRDSVAIPEGNTQELAAYVSGSYYVIATSLGGCTAVSAAQAVSVYANPTPPAIDIFDNVLNASSVYDLQWYYEGDPIPGATGSSYSPAIEGSYSVSATNGPCTVFSATVDFVFQSVTEPDQHNVQVFPNPSGGIYMIHFDISQDAPVQMDVTNILGEKIAGKTFENMSRDFIYQLNITKFADGIYFLQLSNGDFKTTQKIIKHSL